MSSQLQQLLRNIDRLSPADKIQAIAYTIESIKKDLPAEPIKSSRKWRDLKGMATAPLMGEDAQDWVARNRAKGDEQREQLLRVER